MYLHSLGILFSLLLISILAGKIIIGSCETTDDIRAQVPVNFAANLIRFHRLNLKDTKKSATIVIQDFDCKVKDENFGGTYFRRSLPCFYAPRFPQAGGKPWYWSNDVKPIRWNELNKYL